MSGSTQLTPDEERVLATFDHQQGYEHLSESIEQSGLSRKEFFGHLEILVRKKYIIEIDRDILLFRRSNKPYVIQPNLIMEREGHDSERDQA